MMKKKIIKDIHIKWEEMRSLGCDLELRRIINEKIKENIIWNPTEIIVKISKSKGEESVKK